jgi:tetratricopeptide (TPR) repeat protein
LFVAVVATATAISVRQGIRARREAAVSKAISDFLRNDLLSQADPSNRARGQLDPNLTVRAALDRAAHGMDGKFPHQPEVEAALRETMGQTYFGLGQYKSAQVQFQRAAEIYERIAGNDSPITLKTMTELGFADVHLDTVEAERILTHNLEIQRRILGPENLDTISTLSALAWAKGFQGNHAEAGALLKQVVELRQRVLGPEHVDTLEAMHDLAGSYEWQGKHAESEALYRQVLQIQLRIFGERHVNPILLGAMRRCTLEA